MTRTMQAMIGRQLQSWIIQKFYPKMLKELFYVYAFEHGLKHVCLLKIKMVDLIQAQVASMLVNNNEICVIPSSDNILIATCYCVMNSLNSLLGNRHLKQDLG